MKNKMKPDTTLVHVGRNPRAHEGVVNPPVYHASTILYPTVAAHEAAGLPNPKGPTYGRHGTATHRAFEEAVAAVEGGFATRVVPSGFAAVVAAILAFVKAGDHVLMVDSVYQPARRFCDVTLKNFGVETTYYDPRIGAGIAKLIRPNTKMVYCESPGSVTFEVQDIPAIAAEAHKAGAVVLMDNTWAAGILFNAFSHGVDVSIHAATKYIVGHSDAMLGTITATEASYPAVNASVRALGYATGPDDVYLGLRGLRTLSVRLKQHQANALIVAEWLKGRPEVAEVLYPALPGDKDHALWKRDFTGASGLFGVVLRDYKRPAMEAMLNNMQLFGMGASWGGFESLVLWQHP